MIVGDEELKVVLDFIYDKYHYDFRAYAPASVKRRLDHALMKLNAPNLIALTQMMAKDPSVFSTLLPYLTVQVSDMFRDPPYFRVLRERVVPILRTYPSIKIWIAGCATGEEVYSFNILLKEAGLFERSLVYATDISGEALRKAEQGIYAIDRVAKFSQNYQETGGTGSLSDYYTAKYGYVTFDRSLRQNTVFSDHSLATDSVFSEVQLVSCRNVLIYFNRDLQDRAIGLFADALCRKGFLGVGAKEGVRLSKHGAAFADFANSERIFQKY